ncbi:hypothetical protein VTJ49DRAFT_2712 [Mycothermus thermophilus]|uniref:Only prolin and serin are matching in the corresponding protein n=1 Tax=Humicola insolens TaxID=85995 RepID=A0ABR3V9I0_HUMIN
MLQVLSLVEERRKQELVDHDTEHTHPYYLHDSSSSDLTSPSPVTSTFSRTNHPRLPLSGSSSSLELTSPPYPDSPVSPTHSLHATRPSKPQLPDVQEDPSERDDDEPVTPPRQDTGDFAFHGYCLCDAPCSHSNDYAERPAMYPCMTSDLDYDLGFLSDGDFGASLRQKKRRHGSDGFSGWSIRLGSRLPSLSSLPRWRSASVSRRHDLTFSPASDPSLAESRPSFSLLRTRSSRSSSVSGAAHVIDHGHGHDSVPATPALSFYESSESIPLPSPLESEPATLGRRVERDRVAATTPLLPPLMTEAPTAYHAPAASLQTSPLQSPSIIPSPVPEPAFAKPSYPTPPLSSRPSLSSLQRVTISSTVSDVPLPPQIPPTPCLLDYPQDAWSDRLGHANFTIEPQPYAPDTADVTALQTFRANRALARTNYAKHLARTGEHYGSTSKTYALTEAKWAEIEREWQRHEDDLVTRLGGHHFRGEDRSPPMPLSLPRGLLSDDGKFPELGDVDIVGPMERDAVMANNSRDRDHSGSGGHDERRTSNGGSSASLWLKNLAGKVGLRK